MLKSTTMFKACILFGLFVCVCVCVISDMWIGLVDYALCLFCRGIKSVPILFLAYRPLIPLLLFYFFLFYIILKFKNCYGLSFLTISNIRVISPYSYYMIRVNLAMV